MDSLQGYERQKRSGLDSAGFVWVESNREEKEVSKQASGSIESIVQGCTRAASASLSLLQRMSCWFFPKGCSRGSGTQNSREISASSCFMQIRRRFCQHSWQTQWWMPIKQSELGWNEHRVGLRARAGFFFFFCQWNHGGHQIMIWREWVRRTKPVGGCQDKWVWIGSLWFIQIVHSKGVRGEEREEMKERRRLGGGFLFFFGRERERERSRRVERRGLISHVLLSHKGGGWTRAMPGWDRRAGRMRRGSWDRIWCLN